MVWTTTDLIDDEAIEYRRDLGSIGSAEGHERINVEVVLREDLTGSSRCGPAEVSIDGVHLRPADARRLAMLLLQGAETAEAVDRHAAKGGRPR